MKAVRLHAYGDIDQLKYEEVARPEPLSDEVLIEVAATSINPIDWKLRKGEAKGRMPLQLPETLGRDVAGTVVKAGVNVTSPKVGQVVMGLIERGYAEYLTARAADVTVIPDGLDLIDAAALPLVLTTGAELIQHIRPKAGDLVLVTGALGNVGRAAVYYAKKQGSHVFAGVRKDQKEKAVELGAYQVVAIDDANEIAGLPELDAIADTVGHAVIGQVIPKLKPTGVLGSVLGKPKEAEGKSIRVEAFTASPNAALLREMADAVRDGKLIIPIARRMKLSQAGEAQQLAETGGAGGKILLIP
jgi:NADPH:quinone reductase-like Zn-dependent oxidoreductase